MQIVGNSLVPWLMVAHIDVSSRVAFRVIQLSLSSIKLLTVMLHFNVGFSALLDLDELLLLREFCA